MRERLPRSVVGRPFTSMKCAGSVTGSKRIMNSAGSCSETSAFSWGGSSTASSVILSIDASKVSIGRSTPEPKKIWRAYSKNGSSCGLCAAMRLTRGLTVNVTSTISSSVASYPAAQSAQLYASARTLLSEALVSRTPPQPGHRTFHDNSNSPICAAWRKAAMVRSSSRPARAANAQSDPPGRIGRLAYINGPVSFHDEDQTQWAPAIVNRPLSTGDSLWTEPNARSEVSISGTRVRMDGATELDMLAIDDGQVRM